MTFSLSTFVVEVDATPLIAFQAKWQAEADQICRDWISAHSHELTVKGARKIDFPPLFKLRLARTSERAAYEAGGSGVELCGDVPVIRLTDDIEHRTSSNAEPSLETTIDETVDEDSNSVPADDGDQNEHDGDH